MTQRSHVFAVVILASLFSFHATPLLARAPAAKSSRASIHSFDIARRVDANRIGMFVTNYGSFGWDIATGSSGLEYPRGSGHTALFTAGLWLGSDPRVALAEYSSEYGPGVILGGGTPDDSNRPEYVTYKVAPYPDTSHVDDGSVPDPLRHHSWSEYMAGAVPFGAPWKLHRLPDTSTPDLTDSVDVPGPDVLGDQMLWCVYNDADPTKHTNDAGMTAPLGVEVQQTTFAYNRPGPLENTVFLRFVIINKGSLYHGNMYASVWGDPDDGGFTDDLVGVDVPRSLGYAYNATNADDQYGAQTPAVGFDLLQGPKVSGIPLGLTSFNKYVNGTDPNSAQRTLNYMLGLDYYGNPVVDPTTGLPTAYVVPGDPVTGTGWIDANPGDRRMMMNSGAFTLAPGDTQVVWAAIVIGQGVNRLASIQVLRNYDDYVQSFFDDGFPEPPPPPPAINGCLLPGFNCPRALSFWRDECQAAGYGELSLAQLRAIATEVDARYGAFDWPDGTELDGFCNLIEATPSDARIEALQEFAGLAATLVAQDLAIGEANGSCIRLDPNTIVACPPPDTTVGAVAAPLDSAKALAADYQDVDATHPVPIVAADASTGPAFGGGAYYGTSFLSSSLDPVAQPDSFPPVELRFDGTQKAHRYLRQEVLGGSFPPSGNRLYAYGGYFDVPFTAWDTGTGTQLEVGFVERALVESDGSYSPDTSTIATYDRTWGPDDSADGGREFVLIFRRPYAGVPRDELRHDGQLLNGALPLIYALWARRVDPASVFDPSDRFTFAADWSVAGGYDKNLWLLANYSLDPQTVAEYQQITDCVRPITRGDGIGAICDIATPTLASLVDAHAEPGLVRVRWFAPSGFTGAIERSVSGGEWARVGATAQDGAGFIAYEDHAVEDGAHYGYRLSWSEAGAALYAGETWVEIPRTHVLALAGFRPNPAGITPVVAFTLPARGTARIEILDVTGRRRLARDLGTLAPGAHAIRLEGTDALPAGVYFLKLTHGGASVVTRGVLMR